MISGGGLHSYYDIVWPIQYRANKKILTLHLGWILIDEAVSYQLHNSQDLLFQQFEQLHSIQVWSEIILSQRTVQRRQGRFWVKRCYLTIIIKNAFIIIKALFSLSSLLFFIFIFRIWFKVECIVAHTVIDLGLFLLGYKLTVRWPKICNDQCLD